MTKRSHDWGEVRIRRGSDETGRWIEVSDSGTGMSQHILTGPLLDFGTSYWKTEKVFQELPGLLTAGFRPTGQYGIGFFSVFMWGARVRVTTRHFSEGPQATRVLEFQDGVAERPLLRSATADELLHDPGTRVRVWLRENIEPQTSREYCAWLCPSADVSIYVERELAVQANDWLTLDGEALLLRTWAFTNWEGRDDLREKSAALLGPNVRPIGNEDVLGRACFSPCSIPLHAWAANGVITVGGLRACHLSTIAGILIGQSVRAARDVARPLVSEGPLARWASEQASLVEQLGSSAINRATAVAGVLHCGGDIGHLPIAEGANGWIDVEQVAILATQYTELLVASGPPDLEPWRAKGLRLHPNVVMVQSGSAPFIQAGGIFVDWPPGRHGRGPLRAVVEACAKAWNANPDSLHQAWLAPGSTPVARTIGTLANGESLTVPVAILTKPE